MASHNEITGDKLQSKISTKAYDEGYDRIFRKESREKLAVVEERQPIEMHTIYKSIEEPSIVVGRSGPCQLHDACVEEDCQCAPS